jgi:cytochrome c-type biogenesis protein CcmF
MADFGALSVLIALVVSTYAGAVSLVGARRNLPRLLESGRAAIYALAGVLGLSSVAMIQAFVSGDYSIKYVAHYSDAQAPLAYKISAYWGGLDGSMLFWVALLALFAAIAVRTHRLRQREIMPYAIAVMAVAMDFFLYLIIYEKNPFDTFLTEIPIAGQGLNPLLQNPYMVTHPPALYAGFVGMTIPYAFAMGALIAGKLDSAWLAAVRRWALVSWFMLTLGLVLGMIWAYEVLGWGGFWAWDPVENAGLLPWLTATAMLHSMKVYERRGQLRRWTFTLVILTFFLTIFGTFMTRSGIVQSVHAFGKDTRLAWIFTFFMVLIVLVSFGWLLARLRDLRAARPIESWLSREGAYVATNWLFVLATVVVLFATMFPTLSESLGRERVSVTAAFFNHWMVPIGAALLLLTGLCALLLWRKTQGATLRRHLVIPLAAGLLGPGVCGLAGLGASPAALLLIGLASFLMASVLQETVRAMITRARSTGQGKLSALGALIFRVRSPYAGYLVHLGIALMFLGFAGQAFTREDTVSLNVGQSRVFGKYTVRFEGFTQAEDPQKKSVIAELEILIDGKLVGRLQPARLVYNKRPQEPATAVAIQRGFFEDLYITMGKHDLAEGSAALKLVINPLVDWMWLGYLLMALANLLAILPTRWSWSWLRVRPSAAGTAVSLGMAALALVFAMVFAKMNAGAPLVITTLGGFILGLTALAFYRVLDPLMRVQTLTPEQRREQIEEEVRARLQASAEAAE